jgi:uncharacterized OB-fold protein
MTVWPEAKRVEKPCVVCGEIMFCTPTRELCSKCRRKKEVAWMRKRAKERKK